MYRLLVLGLLTGNQKTKNVFKVVPKILWTNLL